MSMFKKTISPVLEGSEDTSTPQDVIENKDVIKNTIEPDEMMERVGPTPSAPDDIFAEQSRPYVKERITTNETPIQSFDKMIKIFYDSEPYDNNISELEVRFGTKGIRPLTKTDYDNVHDKDVMQSFLEKESEK